MSLSERPTLSEVMSLDLNDLLRLNKDELLKATRTLADVGNKRLKRLQSSKFAGMSPAEQFAGTSGGNFKSNKSFNRNQLLKEFARAKKFVSMKTSSVTNFKKTKKSVYERIGGTPPDEREFWRAYRKFSESEVSVYGSTNLQQTLYNEMKNGGDYVSRVREIIRNQYESQSITEYTSSGDYGYDAFTDVSSYDTDEYDPFG